MPLMIKLIHIFGSYGFLFSFLIAFAVGVLAVLRKQIWLERFSAWAFVLSFALLAVAYACGFPPEAALKGTAPEALKLATRHHEMAKFALTGMMLITAASLTVLFKYRQQRFPAWFLPNLLFLSLMIGTFSVRSLVNIWKFSNHPARNAVQAPVSPAVK